MSLFSTLVNVEKTPRSTPPPGFSKLEVSEAERAIAGNLCLCTGYRPIVDVCKSFATDIDMEDLWFNSFWRKGDSKEVKINSLPFYNHSNEICTFPEFLKYEARSALLLDSRRYSWYSPASIEELQRLLGSVADGNGSRIKVVVGNTGMSYYKELESFDKYIDLRCIPELTMIRRDDTGMIIGATVTISKAIEALRHGNIVWKEISDHMEKVASGFVRNSASLGGNLVMAQRNHFPYDIATVLLAVGSLVNLMNGLKSEEITMEEFLRRTELDSNSILVSVKIPDWDRIMSISIGTKMKLLFETYRAAPRPLGNALPYLNAALMAKISRCASSNGMAVSDCRFAFGAYGTKHAIRATKVEEFLTGKVLSVDVLHEAVKLLRSIVVPDDYTSYPAYRSSLASGFLFEFFSHLVEGNAESPNGYVSTLMSHARHLDHGKVSTLLTFGKQEVELNKQYHPVGEPIASLGLSSKLLVRYTNSVLYHQAHDLISYLVSFLLFRDQSEIVKNNVVGEAVYVDDIPSPTNCLHGAFIFSTKPLARVKGIELKPKSVADGVIAVISFKDMPGENLGIKTGFGPEPLFTDDFTRCTGQNIALVVIPSSFNLSCA